MSNNEVGKQQFSLCGADLWSASTSLSRCSDYCADCCGASGSAGSRNFARRQISVFLFVAQNENCWWGSQQLKPQNTEYARKVNSLQNHHAACCFALSIVSHNFAHSLAELELNSDLHIFPLHYWTFLVRYWIFTQKPSTAYWVFSVIIILSKEGEKR